MKLFKCFKNTATIAVSILALCLVGVFISCNKTNVGEYYGYENNNSVYEGTMYDYLESVGSNYDSLLFVLDRCPELKDTLKSENGTLFAIQNKSFDVALKNLNEYRKKQNLPSYSLKDIDLDILDTLISRYFLPGTFTSDSIKFFTNGILLPSATYGYKMNLKYNRQDASGYVGGGPQQIIFTDPKDTTFDVFWVSTYTTAVNIKVKNGIIHEVSPGHEFGFGELLKKLIADRKRKGVQ